MIVGSESASVNIVPAPIAISDDVNVPELVARRVNEGHEPQVPWDELSARAGKRYRQ